MKILEIEEKFPKVYENLKGNIEDLQTWLREYNHKKKITNLKKHIKSRRKRKRIYKGLKT